jgi:N-acetyl-anhydromuramyl-L-alanine amidase AmpD
MTDPCQFIKAAHFTKGRKAKIRLLVMHTTENTEKSGTALAVAKWFAGPQAPQASAHYCIDNIACYQCVLEQDTAWAVGVANPFSVSIELVGRAAQTAEQWADDFSKAELLIAADRAARICKMWDIPITRCVNPKTDAGLCGHMDITKAWAVKGGHTDPGPAFPWDSFIEQVRFAQSCL